MGSPWIDCHAGVAQVPKAEEVDRSRKVVTELLSILENSLSSKAYLLGSKLTLADICVFFKLQLTWRVVSVSSVTGISADVARFACSTCYT